MAAEIRIKRGTRANLNTLAGSSGLNDGEPYWITDEDVLAIGTAATTYTDISYLDADAVAAIAAADDYVKLVGDTMSGPLLVDVSGGGAELSLYADTGETGYMSFYRDAVDVARVGRLAAGNDDFYVSANTGDLYMRTLDGTVRLWAQSGSAAAEDIVFHADDATGTLRQRLAILGDSSTTFYDYNAVTRMSVDTLGVTVSGRLGGSITDPTHDSHVGDRGYNDARYAVGDLGDYLPLVGGTLSGNLNLDASGPTLYLDRATQGGGPAGLYYQTADVTRAHIGLISTSNDDLYFRVHNGTDVTNRLVLAESGDTILYDRDGVAAITFDDDLDLIRLYRPTTQHTAIRAITTSQFEGSTLFYTNSWSASADQVGYLVFDMDSFAANEVLTTELEISGTWSSGASMGLQRCRSAVYCNYSGSSVNIYANEYPDSFGEIVDEYKVGAPEEWDDGGAIKMRWPIYKLNTSTTSAITIKLTIWAGGPTPIGEIFDNVSWVTPTTVTNSETAQGVTIENDVTIGGTLFVESIIEPLASGADLVFRDSNSQEILRYDDLQTQWEFLDTVTLNNNSITAVGGVSSWELDLWLTTSGSTATPRTIKLRTWTGSGNEDRVWVEAEDIIFFKADGSTVSAQWDESDDQWEFGANVDMGGHDILAVGDVLSSAAQPMRVGTTAAASRVEFDNADVTIFDGDGAKRLEILNAGDISLYDEDGVNARLTWDESETEWVMSGDLNLSLFDIWGVQRVGYANAAPKIDFSATTVDIYDDVRTRITIAANATGDITIRDSGGATTLLWDESDDQWEFGANVDMGGNNITNVQDIEFSAWAGGDYVVWDASTAEVAALKLWDDTATTWRNVLIFVGQDHGSYAGDVALYSPSGGAQVFRFDHSDDRVEFSKNVDMSNKVLSGPLDPTAGTHVGDRDYNDARYVQEATAFHTFTLEDDFVTGSGVFRIPITVAQTIVRVRVMCATAPTGASAIFDINKNGTTIYTTQGNCPTIAASATDSGTGTAPDVTALAAGDYLTVDIDQAGSTVAGADGVLVIEVTVP